MPEHARVAAQPAPGSTQARKAGPHRAPGQVALLDLQRLAGNQAVAQLVAEPAGPAVDPRARVDQLELAIRLKPFPRPAFYVDRDAAAAALAGLTEEDGRAIRAEYKQRTSHDLGWLLSGQLEIDNNLGEADRKRLLILLHGTVAPAATDPTHGRAIGELAGAVVGGLASMVGSEEDAERLRTGTAEGYAGQVAEQEAKAAAAASTSRYAAEAAELKAALDRGAAEAVLAMIRRPDAENQALAEQYQRHFHESLYNALVTKLKGRDAERAAALWIGDLVTADRLALEGDIERQKAAEADVARFGAAAEVMPDIGDKLKSRRREARAAVESRVEAVGGEGQAATAEERAQGREHLRAVLAQPEAGGVTLGAQLGVGTSSVVTAIAEGDEPEALAARLARADAERSLKAADLEGAIRQLRGLARATAFREIEHQPAALAPQSEAVIDAVTQGYYQRFQERFDRDNPARPLAAALASIGGGVERERNQALLAGRGELPEWQELDFALRREPKDMDRVRRILGRKTRTQVDDLAATYHERTAGNRSLEADLMGSAEQQLLEQVRGADAAAEAQAEKRELLQGGVFSSTATDETTRLAEEGRWTFGRIAGLERRVMENRGLFAEARDWVGNLEHELVERARDDAANAKTALDLALAAQPADLVAARAQLEELQHVAARLQHNVGVYKEATAEAFNDFVDFAVLVVTTAVTLGEGTAVMLAVRSTAATIGTKLVLKGDDYTLDEFLGDLRAGAGAAAGGKLAEKMVGPLASRLAKYAEQKGLSKTLAGKVAGAFSFESENLLTTATTNVATGKDITSDMGLEAHVKNIAMGQVTSGIKAVRGGKAAGHEAGPGTEPTTHAGEGPAEPSAGERTEPTAAGENPALSEPEMRAPAEDPWAAAAGLGPAEPLPEATTTTGPGSAGGEDTRKPPGPLEPGSAGIPEGTAKSLQDVANQLDVVIKARPVNVESAQHLERGALAKMELVKAKTVTRLDELIGAPPDSRGLVALFRPRPPDPHLPPNLLKAAWKRYGERYQEYRQLRPYYQRYMRKGLVRLEGGVLKVADPRTAGGPEAPHGQFKPVAGDVDLFDITHADGSPLTADQRTYVQKMLQSMGIGVEHGAHAWWAEQRPETYDPKMDERIRAQHQEQEQLVAFIPGQDRPHGVWADTPVGLAHVRERGTSPLKEMEVVGEPGAEPREEGTPEPEYVDMRLDDEDEKVRRGRSSRRR